MSDPIEEINGCRCRVGHLHHSVADTLACPDVDDAPVEITNIRGSAGMTDQIEEIRKRNEEFIPEHRHESGDPFYSCPKRPEYMGHEDRDYCNCDHDDQVQTKADIDTLLAYIDRIETAFTEALRDEGEDEAFINDMMDILWRNAHPDPDIANRA